MSPAPPKSGKAGSGQPRWGWSGVSRLDQPDQESNLQQLTAMLPAKKSSDAAVLAYLVELRGRFHGWLHQDEFGPSRAEQTAALRALLKTVGTLCKLLKKGTPRCRMRFDTALNDSSDTVSPLLVLGEVAAELEFALRVEGAPEREIDWISKVASCGDTLSQQIELVDDNTHGQIADTAAIRGFEPSFSAASESLGLASAERWLAGYWRVLVETSNRLRDKRGAEERSSLKLLVEELCALWQRETGLPATAHGIVRDVYTHRTETDAGRFVSAAVEAMLPDKGWYEAHAEFAHSVRAETFWPDESGKIRRAGQVLVIMRGFARRRPKPRKTREPSK
jgi:hypothetical protein